MRRKVLILLFDVFFQFCYAQSVELRRFFNNATSTLKEYTFQSEDVHRFDERIYHGWYKTRSLSFKITNGNYIFTLIDAYEKAGTYIPKANPGKKTITVPIREATFRVSNLVSESYITISGIAGIEYEYNNKREILNDFKIYGSKLTLNKLYNELTLLNDKCNSESFKGNLGVITTKKQTLKNSGAVGYNRNKTIRMKKMASNTYLISCKVNGLPLNFIFDTGASSVTLSRKQAIYMFEKGYLSKSDVVGSGSYKTASGDIALGTIIRLKKIEIDGLVLRNVEASIINSDSAPLLLGQSALSRLGKIQIDYKKSTLTIIR